MIDWLTMIVPCTHVEPIRDGGFQRVDATGEVEWSVDRRLSLKGSFDSSVTVRTHHGAESGDRTHIEVSGNIVKFFQGHNLWGSDDAPALAFEFMRWLALNHGLSDSPLVSPTESDIAAWKAGGIRITRIDLTESFHLDNRAQVLAWLRAAEQTAHLSHRGRGQLVKGSTLYFGKNSRRWSLKLYSKGQEITAKGHGQDAILGLPYAREWADRTLRAELTLRSMELKRMGRDMVSGWFDDDGLPSSVTARLLHERLGGMTMTTTSHLSAEILDAMRPALRLAYQSWESGSDLRAILPHRTFYKYRSELLPHGIDIATLVPREVSNVVPLFRTLEATPASIPDWAIGTPLYFEPTPIRRTA